MMFKRTQRCFEAIGHTNLRYQIRPPHQGESGLWLLLVNGKIAYDHFLALVDAKAFAHKFDSLMA